MARDDEHQDDVSLFRQAVGDASPIAQDRIEPEPARPAPIPGKTLEDNQAVMKSLLSDDFDPAEIDSGEALLFRRPGVQGTVFRKLRTGKYLIQGELDLHGKTVPEAREALAAFLKTARGRGWRCVRVIHGKGLSSEGRLPVLKGKVNNWLQQKDEVLAFCSARPVDGGTGAVYVLLRRTG
jgi:DNA-nicking Smr family endonuclease